MTTAMALESLVQRGRSPLYTDLISLYQETQDTLRDVPKAYPTEVSRKLRDLKFPDKLIAIVKKHTGIVLSQMIIVAIPIPNMGISMRVIDTDGSVVRPVGVSPGVFAEKMNSFYNDKTGKLTLPSFTEMPLRFTLSTCVGWWVYREDDGSYVYTAEEIAAATLHELGHVDDHIRVYGRICRRTQDAADLVNYVVDSVDPKNALALIDAVRKSPYLNRDWLGVLATLEQYFKQAHGTDDAAYAEALSVLAAMVTSEAGSFNLAQYKLNLYLMTDRAMTRLQDIDKERSADEYTARNGATAAMASFITKVEVLETTKAIESYRYTKSPAMAVMFGTMRQFQRLFQISAEDISNGYDPLLRRVSLLIETSKHAFHDESLSAEAKDDLKLQIAEAEKYLKDYQSSTHYRSRQAIKKWRDNMAKFGRILAAPFQNRMAQDYERLQNDTRSLSRHPLYYIAKQ